jgi:hypothetical protein
MKQKQQSHGSFMDWLDDDDWDWNWNSSWNWNWHDHGNGHGHGHDDGHGHNHHAPRPELVRPQYDAINGRIDERGIQDIDRDMFAGNGNSPDGFAIVREHSDGVDVEIALKGKLRGGADIPGHLQSDGLVHYEVPAGNNGATPARALWNFDYSVTSKQLDDLTLVMKLDTDPRANHTDYVTLIGERVSPGALTETPPTGTGLPSGFVWREADTGTAVISDDKGWKQVTQNSENILFNFWGSHIDANPDTAAHDPYTGGPGHFDVVMAAYHQDRHYDVGEWQTEGFKHLDFLTVNHVVFDV